MWKNSHGRAKCAMRIWEAVGAVVLACGLLAAMAGIAPARESAVTSIGPAVTIYAIDAVLDPAVGRLEATARIAVPTTVAGPGDTLHVDVGAAGTGADGAAKLTIDEIRLVGGARIEARPNADGDLAIALPTEATGPVLELRYSMSLEDADRERFGYYLFMGVDSGNCWYPLVSGPGGERTRFHDFHTTLEYPEGWAAMVSGEPINDALADTGLRETYRARHVEGCALVLGEGFVRRTIERGGIVVTAFSSPDVADDFQVAAEHTARAAAWYESTYGFFPAPHIGVIQGHPRWGGGYPLPQMFMVHLASLKPDFLRWITAHELGHYYWGLHVLDEGDRLGWLTLANGIWADQLYMADMLGVDPAEQWRSRRYGDWMVDYLRAVAENREEELGLDRAVVAELDFDYNSLVRHGKGATGLYLQASLLGRDAFLEFQRGLLHDYGYRPLPEDEFVDRLVAAGAHEAREFFVAWKRGDARIGLQVEGVNDSTVTVARTGHVPYPIDVEIVGPAGDVVCRTLAAGESRVVIPVTGPRPLDIRLDPAGVVPMADSGHPGMRGVRVEALDRAGPTAPFLAAARLQLDNHPDDHRTRYLLVARLHDLACHREAVRWGRPARLPVARYDCAAVIYAARSLARLGEYATAWRHLDACHEPAVEFGLEGLWERARAELP
ncbi:MAG: M1 family metallopeptidase [bacterium]|nr:M1 family metallopeptidase [bacterium]